MRLRESDDCRHVDYSLHVTMESTAAVPSDILPDNMVDSKTVKETMARFKDKLGPDGCFVVD